MGDLTEAERLREDIGRDEVWSALNAFTDGSRMRSDLLHVMAEFDRLKAENAELRELLAIRDEQVEENNAIIEAAYRVAASWSPHSTEEFDGDLVAALVREVQQ